MITPSCGVVFPGCWGQSPHHASLGNRWGRLTAVPHFLTIPGLWLSAIKQRFELEGETGDWRLVTGDCRRAYSSIRRLLMDNDLGRIVVVDAGDEASFGRFPSTAYQFPYQKQI